MKPLILSILVISALSYGASYTDTMSYTYDSIETTKTVKYVYNSDYSTLKKTISCMTLIDTYSEEVISKKCITKKY